jgi:hypothetical protein
MRNIFNDSCSGQPSAVNIFWLRSGIMIATGRTEELALMKVHLMRNVGGTSQDPIEIILEK